MAMMPRARYWQWFSEAGERLVILGMAGMTGLVAGVVSGSGRIGVVAILGALFVGLALGASRKALLWFVIIGGIVISGASQLYVPGSRYLRYVIPLAAGGLILHAILDALSRRAGQQPVPPPPLINWSIAFLILAIASAAVNTVDPGVAVTGVKNYFQMWPLLFGMYLVRWRPEVIDSLPKGMLLVAFLQLPFALHQYLFLVPKRQGLEYTGLVPVDIVSGTFGGTLYGGGANAVLAAFLVVASACLLGVWKRGGLSGPATAAMVLPLLGPIFVNSAKITALYLPLIFLVLFAREMVARPLRFLLIAPIAAAMVAALMTALTLSQGSDRVQTWSDLVEFTFERQTASVSERRGQYSELSRWTALTFWANEHRGANPVYVLIGHGPGASQVQEGGLNLAETLAETRYGGLQIGYTAVSALLWDTGVLGLGIVLMMFFAAFRSAGKLSRHYQDTDPVMAGVFDGLRAGIAVLALSLAHKDFFVVNLPYQTFVLLIFGFLAVHSKRVAAASADAATDERRTL